MLSMLILPEFWVESEKADCSAKRQQHKAKHICARLSLAPMTPQYVICCPIPKQSRPMEKSKLKDKAHSSSYVCTFRRSQGFMLAFQAPRIVQKNVFVHTLGVMKRGYNILRYRCKCA